MVSTRPIQLYVSIIMRKLSRIDQLLKQSDQALRTVSGNTQHPQRPSPAQTIHKKNTADSANALSEQKKKHIAALMRVNHTGEVCAQALYQGQAIFAKSTRVKTSMENAAAEEIDHLVWCEQRLSTLNSRVSYLNPIWYGLSFGLGAIAGAMGDRWSLGFVKETEDQVGKHLNEHLDQIPVEDQETRAILNQMQKDEAHHALNAKEQGARELPQTIKHAMRIVSKVMTRSTYYI